MPTKQIENLAKKCNKTVKEVEKHWDEAKEIVEKEYKKKESDPDYWKLVYGITRNKSCGKNKVKENIMIEDYLNSICESYINEDEQMSDISNSDKIDDKQKFYITKSLTTIKNLIKNKDVNTLNKLSIKMSQKIKNSKDKFDKSAEQKLSKKYGNTYKKVNGIITKGLNNIGTLEDDKVKSLSIFISSVILSSDDQKFQQNSLNAFKSLKTDMMLDILKEIVLYATLDVILVVLTFYISSGTIFLAPIGLTIYILFLIIKLAIISVQSEESLEQSVYN